MKFNIRYALCITILSLFVILGSGVNAVAYTLSGIVYGGGNPLPNATVTLTNATTLIQLDTTTTDADGFYSFTVSDGSYNLNIIPPDGSGFIESVVNGVLVNGGDLPPIIVPHLK